MRSEPRVIVSLDFPTADEASLLVSMLDPVACRLKVGKELFTRCGPSIIEKFTGQGFDVFLDLKFHDIPNTVARACQAAAKLGVWMLDVHACGGRQMLEMAREALDKQSHQPLLIAVTVLTSMDEADMNEVGVPGTVSDQVLRLTSLARQCALDGVVCSAREVGMIRHAMGSEFKLVTPGIRPVDSTADDQRRISTPVQAIEAGSDYLVIGRPVTQASDPLKVLESINSEIESIEEAI
ncbi:MAG: orotidine-5'-phosphate decarboxylase [Gammaproteobacteria bacterium]|nr:orotidine-5'-phosphate decarboxylase [Gammaproteobacteria bacterium]NIN61420.1 orotidine-5'-phosphate decarboxylase [Gammaproteobacteria bacterium]NIO61187.1 orotidine-5'-phosphate decarboxylase [Gammaproteobacteria bacterium]NIP48879.1 orotidine-5'-phosphate decarboxylase [Gammaproteobacteria bacterium]NIQ09333.1 orotidine-5'-phosphate decarboxylase [Gammaproteobacteria bacterium]